MATRGIVRWLLWRIAAAASVEIPVPTCRTWTIGAESRTLTVGAESRVWEIEC